MKIIVAAIEYKTPNLIDKFIDEWVKNDFVVKIYIGSTTLNKSSSQSKLFKIVNNIEVYYVDILNFGYGSAMNSLIKIIKEDMFLSIDSFNYLFIGNIDVYPIEILSPSYLDDQSMVPIINILENNRNRNPFLTKLQKSFLFLFKLPLKFNSVKILLVVIIVFKILSLFKSKPWAVHGSFFCFNKKMLMVEKPFFNNSFLYCEELFYAREVEKLKIELIDSNISVRHVGGVSTQNVINFNKQTFFKFWKQSMTEYFYSKN